MKIALTLIFTVMCVTHVDAAEPGITGILLDDADFRIVKRVLRESPAARAGVQPGDRILAVNGYPASQIRGIREFSSRVDGTVGTELKLQLDRAGAPQPWHVRMRRVPIDALDFTRRHIELRYGDGRVEVVPGK